MDEPTRERIEIDPDGDVCAVTTDSKTGKHVCFIVQSKVLSLASPYFRMMFKPVFKTGITLKDLPGGHAPLEIDAFLDDESSAMHTFFKTLHNLPDPSPLSLEVFANLAIIVDKYGCQLQFRALSTMWFEKHVILNRRQNAYPVFLEEYLGISIAFRNTDMFAIVALGLALTTGKIWNRSTVRKRVEGTRLGNHVTEEIYNAIEDMRDGRLWNLCHAIEDFTSRSEQSIGNSKYCGWRYGHYQHVIDEYTRALHKNQLDIVEDLPSDITKPVFYKFLQLVEVAKQSQSYGWCGERCDSRCEGISREQEIEDCLFRTFMEMGMESNLEYLRSFMPGYQLEAHSKSWNVVFRDSPWESVQFHPCMKLLIGDFAQCSFLTYRYLGYDEQTMLSVEFLKEQMEEAGQLILSESDQDQTETSSSDEDESMETVD